MNPDPNHPDNRSWWDFPPPPAPSPDVNPNGTELIPGIDAPRPKKLDEPEDILPPGEDESHVEWNKRGQKRSPVERAEDIAFTESCLARKWTPSEILDDINSRRPYCLTISQIWYDIRAIGKGWRGLIVKLDERKALELASLDRLESEMWKAWENSKKKRTERQQRKTVGGKNDGASSMQVVERETGGDARYAAIILKCIEGKMRILGLYQVEAQQDTGEEKRIYGTPTDLLEKRYKEHLLRQAEEERARKNVVTVTQQQLGA